MGTVIGGTFIVALVNPTRIAIELRVGTPVAAVHLAVLNSASNCDAAACDNRLDAESKLLRVLRELQFDDIPNSAEHKLPL